MKKKDLLLSIAAITSSITGASANTDTEDSANDLNEDFTTSANKSLSKKQFVLKVDFSNWENSEGVSHRSHSSHSSHSSHRSHYSHRSSTFI